MEFFCSQYGTRSKHDYAFHQLIQMNDTILKAWFIVIHYSFNKIKFDTYCKAKRPFEQSLF